VDPRAHPEIREFLPALSTSMKVTLSAVNVLAPSMMSPTKDLGRVLVNLAMGEGGPVDGPGVDGDGRTVSNVAMRRIAGL
jgi:hypothetical protein